jgi:hypothetical protein
MFNSTYKKIFAGKYEFLSAGEQYAEENFELFYHTQNKSYYHKIYQLSKSGTGEIFKSFIELHVDEQQNLEELKITRSVGHWTCTEEYKHDLHQNNLHYTLTTPDEIKEESKKINKKFIVTTSAAFNALVICAQKKFDSGNRNLSTLIRSNNLMSYVEPLKEETIFINTEVKEGQTFYINQKNYPYLKYELFHHNVNGQLDMPIIFHVSKKHSIPFLIQYDKNTEARLIQLEISHEIDEMSL